MTSGDLPQDLSLLLDRILDFPERDVEHAMIPRARCGGSRNTPIAEMRARMAKRTPAIPCSATTEEPIGVVHLREVLAADPDDPRPVSQSCGGLLSCRPSCPCRTRSIDLTRHQQRIGMRDRRVRRLHRRGDHGGPCRGTASERSPTSTIDGVPEPAWSARATGLVMDGDLPLDEVERAIGSDLPAAITRLSPAC